MVAVMHRFAFRAIALLWSAAAASAWAAGGHHAVDDAAIVDPGQCQVETWVDAFGPGGGAQHVGPACRVGAWEIGLNLDRTRFAREPAFRVVGPQAKWVTTFAEGWSVGVAAGPGWEAGRYNNTIVLLPLTWQPSRAWLVHANLGRQWVRGAPGRTLAGLAAEWTASETFSFVAERFNDPIGRAYRVGGRWQPNPLFSLDLSRARAFADARGSWWTLGVTLVADGVVP